MEGYHGEMPFSHFLKAFFQREKKYGSRDRKAIADYAYSAFRLGKAGKNWDTRERILSGFFLTHHQPSEMLAALRPEWNERMGDGILEKITLLRDPIDPLSIFPWTAFLSESIDREAYCLSYLTQPDLFLRIRPKQEEIVLQKLTKAGIPFEKPDQQAIRLPNSAKIDGVLEINKEVVVQDLSSQHCLDYDWKKMISPFPTPFRVWDACAASGGKSILLWDQWGPVDLTVSDSRASILANLQKRFSEAGIGPYKKIVADLTRPLNLDDHPLFDLIIADVPCSGSGTWARSPEQLVFFEETAIEKYVQLQRSVLTHLIPHLKPGGQLVYITCSVFKKENEENLNWLTKNFDLEEKEKRIHKGYPIKADSLFSARLVFSPRAQG